MILKGKLNEAQDKMADAFQALAKEYGQDCAIMVTFRGDVMTHCLYGITEEKEKIMDAISELVVEAIDMSAKHQCRQ